MKCLFVIACSEDLEDEGYLTIDRDSGRKIILKTCKSEGGRDKWMMHCAALVGTSALVHYCTVRDSGDENTCTSILCKEDYD